MSAPTTEGRLICASNCTYSVGGNGPLGLNPDDTYYAGAGFTQPPIGFVDGPAAINACLVGTILDGVVVAFRGTLTSADATTLQQLVEDWMNDFNAEPIGAPGMVGQVHKGFYGAMDSLWLDVLPEVQKQLALLAVPRLFVTGHSKGGGMAPLAAVRFVANSIPCQVVTFAAARAGDQTFAADYNGRITHTRYEYADDIVPHLPPSAPFLDVLSSLPLIGSRFATLERFDYEAVGTLDFINWNGQIVKDSPTLNGVRFLHLAEIILTMKYKQIRADHSIECGGGYMAAVCPTGVCG